MTKRELLDGTDNCLANAADDEPLFVLRAQDLVAPDTIRQWALLAQLQGTPRDKIEGAIKEAQEMENWEHRKRPD